MSIAMSAWQWDTHFYAIRSDQWQGASKTEYQLSDAASSGVLLGFAQASKTQVLELFLQLVQVRCLLWPGLSCSLQEFSLRLCWLANELTFAQESA